MALTVLECAANQKRLWAMAARIAGREAHGALAQALRAARRGLAVRGRCRRCGGRLDARPALRTAHCARAFHADCEPEQSCATCGQPVPDRLLSLPPLAPRAASPPPDHRLRLVAPPRPDLEGLV